MAAQLLARATSDWGSVEWWTNRDFFSLFCVFGRGDIFYWRDGRWELELKFHVCFGRVCVCCLSVCVRVRVLGFLSLLSFRCGKCPAVSELKKKRWPPFARARPPSSHTKAQKLGLDFSPSFASWKSLDYFFRPALSHKNSRISNVWVPRDLSVRDSLNTIKKKKEGSPFFCFFLFKRNLFDGKTDGKFLSQLKKNK